ncbi:MAG: putative metal-binding motif-containing protein [Myxococcota bacterium]
MPPLATSWRPLGSALAALALGACPGGDQHQGTDDAGVDSQVLPDVIAFDSVTSAPDSAADSAVATDAIAPDGDEADGGPTAGALGAACDEAEDCNSSFCLEGRDGGVCSQTCIDACPNGWACRQNVAALRGPMSFLCIPPWPTLYRPCRSNADCLADHDVTAHACIPSGDVGSFCGALCQRDEDCPGDAFCSQVVDVAGNTTHQCVPASGECGHPAPAPSPSTSTDCAIGNALGRCRRAHSCGAGELIGLRRRDAGGRRVQRRRRQLRRPERRGPSRQARAGAENEAGACRATTPATARRACATTAAGLATAETCDSSDEDCDGETDERSALGYHLVRGRRRRRQQHERRHLRSAPRRAPSPPPPVTTATTRREESAPAPARAAQRRRRRLRQQRDRRGRRRRLHRLPLRGRRPRRLRRRRRHALPVRAARALRRPRRQRLRRRARRGSGPSAVERCSGQDDDCDSQTDEEGASVHALYFEDGDGDGYGRSIAFRCTCGALRPRSRPARRRLRRRRHGLVSPGAAEVCGDDLDDDCDELTDEAGALGCARRALPRRRSRRLRPRRRPGHLCDPEAPYDTPQGGDCADGEARANPDAVEVCDGIDNDHDSTVDEPAPAAAPSSTRTATRTTTARRPRRRACAQRPSRFTEHTTDDCDDSNPFILDASGCTTASTTTATPRPTRASRTSAVACKDEDQDGLQSKRRVELPVPARRGAAASPPAAAATATTTASTPTPLAEELCNGQDDDCDGETDEAGALGSSPSTRTAATATRLRPWPSGSRCLCAAAAPYSAAAPGDCDDQSARSRRARPKVCNGKDTDDCDTLTGDPAPAAARSSSATPTATASASRSTRATCARRAGPIAPPSAATATTSTWASTPPQPVCDGKDDDCNGVADDHVDAGLHRPTTATSTATPTATRRASACAPRSAPSPPRAPATAPTSPAPT